MGRLSWLICVGLLESQGSLYEGGRRSEEREDATLLALKK